MDLTRVKGLGTKTAVRLRAAGLDRVEDILAVFPRRYDDRRVISPIAGLKEDQRATVIGKIIGTTYLPRRGSRPAFATLIVQDDSGTLKATFFGAPAKGVRKTFPTGKWTSLTGPVKLVKGALNMGQPGFQILGAEKGEGRVSPGIVPQYRVPGGLGQKRFSSFIKSSYELMAHRLMDALPYGELGVSDFPTLQEAFRDIHFPEDDADIELLNAFRTSAHRRMIFDELFFLQLGLMARRRRIEAKTLPAMEPLRGMEKRIRRLLGFSLTEDQESVLARIRRDLVRSRPMHRLLQGDVGCGKTVVAFLAAAMVIENRRQAAIMAPTEVLAAQHHRRLQELCRPLGIRAALLVGATPAGEVREILDAFRSGEGDLLIGTQALISRRVIFRDLGLAVIDEQHRFGVAQRARLSEKQANPHVLVMSATPIPRSLAMTVYGDLDLSLIRRRPPGRVATETILIRGETEAAYQRVRERLKGGDRAFIIYPLVEESEKLALRAATQMFGSLSRDHFSDYPVGLLHGRMTDQEKEEVLADFTTGRIRVLVATTIVELGLDVAEAGVILIEHADRFGLSQLHQLRGRVGRSDRRDLCILSVEGEVGEKALRRLQVLVREDDGFVIAEEDLAIRGPGDILGRRQHGLPALRWALLARDMELLKKARRAARKILKADPDLTRHPRIARVLKHRWGGLLPFGDMG